MAAGYDGSIKFDTRIDSTGFNQGITRITKSLVSALNVLKPISNYFDEVASRAKLVVSGLSGLSGSAKNISNIAEVIGGIAGILGTIVTIIGTIIGIVLVLAIVAVAAGIAIYTWAQKFTETLYKSLSVTSAYHDQVVQLKNAFDSVKGATMALGTTLLSALAPAIMVVINWLVKAINWVSMFIAALTGQKTVMQYVSGSADGAAKSTGNAAKNADALAKNTDKAGKAAKGALANFDQLNVLQQETNTDQVDQKELNTGNYSGGNIQMIEVPIDPKIKSKIDEIKGWFTQAWQDISNWALVAKDKITEIWGTVSDWIKLHVIDPIAQRFNWLWDILKNSWSLLWDGPGGLKIIFDAILVFLSGFFTGQFQAAFTMVGNVLKTFLTSATGVVDGILKTFGGIIEFLTGIFTGDWALAWQGIKDIFTGIFESIVYFINGAVNIIIDVINGMIAGVISGVNAVIAALNTIHYSFPSDFPIKAWAGKSFGISIAPVEPVVIPHLPIPDITQAYQVPQLARGAVIPPNAAFAAVLGDQRHGTNIETPESLLRQIMREELAGSGEQQISISFGGSLGALVRELKPYIDKENKRIGKSLIVGGTTS